MSTRIPSSLNWLIDKRARIDAEIRKTKNSIKAAQKILEELSSLEEVLSSIDKTLDLHDIKVDLNLIAPVRSKYVRLNLPHGALKQTVLLCLRVRGGDRPVGSSEIADFLEARHTELSVQPVSRVRLTRSVHRCLNILYSQGLVLRHHDPTKNLEGFWSLPLD